MKYFYLIFLILLASCIGKWNTYSTKKYSIKYPDYWKLITNETKQAEFFLITPLTSEDDLFGENINLVIQTITDKNIDLDKFIKVTESQFDTLFTNGKIEVSEKLQSNSGEFQKIIATADVNGVEMKFEQRFWIKNKKVYILTLTCQKDSFEKYQVEAETIMDSFVIKK